MTAYSLNTYEGLSYVCSAWNLSLQFVMHHASDKTLSFFHLSSLFFEWNDFDFLTLWNFKKIWENRKWIMHDCMVTNFLKNLKLTMWPGSFFLLLVFLFLQLFSFNKIFVVNFLMRQENLVSHHAKKIWAVCFIHHHNANCCRNQQLKICGEK